MRPVCAQCHVEMLCEKNGITVGWEAHHYHGDRYRCPVCGHLIVAGFGQACHCQAGVDIELPDATARRAGCS
jgi:DNA-directed RNA polymerase subunit RPC12/RpoP